MPFYSLLFIQFFYICLYFYSVVVKVGKKKLPTGIHTM